MSAPTQIARCYIRVSEIGGRDTQDAANPRREFLSPGIQLDSAADWAARNGYTFDRESSLKYQDLGYSGFKKHWQSRPGIMAHLAAAQRGEFDKLIVYKLSRLARRTEDALQMIREFERAGVGIYAIKEAIDTSTAAGRMVQTIMLAVAEMQSEDIRDYAIASVSKRAEGGQIQGRPPFWIKRTEDGKGFEIDTISATPMLRMVELREDHLGYTRIAQVMNAEGYRTEDDTPWSSSLIQRYLSPPEIDRLAGRHQVQMKRGGPLHIIENAYPSLIEPHRIDALKLMGKMLAGKRDLQAEAESRLKRRGAALETKYTLSSRIWCGICGARMDASCSSDRLTYRCSARRDDTAAHGGDRGITVSVDVVESAVMRVIDYVMASSAELINIPRTPRKKTRKTTEDTPESIREAMSELASMRLAKRITREVYDSHYLDLEARMEALEAADQEEDAPALFAAAREALASGNKRGAILSLVLSVIVPWDAPETEQKHPNSTRERRRSAFVELRVPTPQGKRFISPFYKTTHRGAINLYTAEGERVAVPKGNFPSPPTA